jgi:hypothetical protein
MYMNYVLLCWNVDVSANGMEETSAGEKLWRSSLNGKGEIIFV